MNAAVDIILALSALTRAAVNIGVDFQRYRELQALADAEGRELTADELNELAQTAYAAQREAYAAVDAAQNSLDLKD